MGYHHLALAARDMKKIHHFYEEVLGFELVKVEVGPSPGGGWAKHYFYRMDNDSNFIAFWEMHGIPGTENFQSSLSKGAGVPDYINHISFDAKDMTDLMRRKDQWLRAGFDVLEIDHNWCHSVYTKDPNDNMVEFCVTTGAFTAEDRKTALAALGQSEPSFSRPPKSIQHHKAKAA